MRRAESDASKLIAEAKAKAEWEAAQVIAEARKQAEGVITQAGQRLKEAPAPQAEVKVEVEPAPQAEVATEAKPAPQAEVKVEAEPAPQAEVKVEAEPAPQAEVTAEATPAPDEFTPPLAGSVPVEDPLARLAQESLQSQAELSPLPVAAVPEVQPAAEPEPEAKAEEKAAASNGDGDGLYRGTLELDITSVDAQQVPIFLSQLQQIPNLQVVSFKGLPGGNSIIALSISHPLPLPDIIKRMSPVESVEGSEKGVHVVLKAASL
jgi:hypothetical protein